MTSALENENGLLAISGDRGLSATAKRSSSGSSEVLLEDVIAVDMLDMKLSDGPVSSNDCCCRIDAGGAWATILLEPVFEADLGDTGPVRNVLNEEYAMSETSGESG